MSLCPFVLFLLLSVLSLTCRTHVSGYLQPPAVHPPSHTRNRRSPPSPVPTLAIIAPRLPLCRPCPPPLSGISWFGFRYFSIRFSVFRAQPNACHGHEAGRRGVGNWVAAGGGGGGGGQLHGTRWAPAHPRRSRPTIAPFVPRCNLAGGRRKEHTRGRRKAGACRVILPTAVPSIQHGVLCWRAK
jgi:hypothetical protein